MATLQLRRGTSAERGILLESEPYFNTETLALEVGDGFDGFIVLAKLEQANSGSFVIQEDLTVKGDLFVEGTQTILNVTTVSVEDNIIEINTAGELLGGIYVKDITGTSTVSGSLLWNGQNDQWIAGISGSEEKILLQTDLDILNSFTESTEIRLDYLEVESGSIRNYTASNDEVISVFRGDFHSYSSSINNFTESVDLRVDTLERAMSGSIRLYVSPSGSDDNDGTQPATPFQTIKAAVESLGTINPFVRERYTIFVGSGDYTEQTPITVPPGVAIVGDSLRTVRLRSENPKQDFFHCYESTYFTGLRFLDQQSPSFCFSFPASTAESIISGGAIVDTTLVYSYEGYTNGTDLDIGILIEPPDDPNGTTATALANITDGKIVSLTITDGGSGYEVGEKPLISIPLPENQRPFVSASPYVQNCSSITGPFDTNGNLVNVLNPTKPGFITTPYDVDNYDGQGGQIDPTGAGGGIRIDGNLVSNLSPLESFVADAFTQVNQGGPGHLVANNGYAQFVSCFTTFCSYGFKTFNGGFANISNSVIDFGDLGLVAKSFFPDPYNEGTSLETKTSSVSGFTVLDGGVGYDPGSIVGVQIIGGGGSGATAQALVDGVGRVQEIQILTAGSGYTFEPTVVIDPPQGGGGATALAISIISGVKDILISVDDSLRGVDISSNMILDGVNYLVTDVKLVEGEPGQRIITTFPSPPSIEIDDELAFHDLSYLTTGGMVFEYVGSGTTYNALPKFGGVPDETKEITEIGAGRIFFAVVDQIGNFKVGDFFKVNQLNGDVSISANNFNLTGINSIGPFRRGGAIVGTVLQEVSNNTNLRNSTGEFGQDTVPTQFAVDGYLSSSIVPRLDTLETESGSIRNYTSSINDYTESTDFRLDSLEVESGSIRTDFHTYTQSTDERIDDFRVDFHSYSSSINNYTESTDFRLNEIETYTSSLKTAIDVNGADVTVLGNFTVEGTQTILNTETLTIEDNIIEINIGGSLLGGIYVKDVTEPSKVSGSLLWNGQTDQWIAGISGSEERVLLQPDLNILNSFTASTETRLSSLETESGSIRTDFHTYTQSTDQRVDEFRTDFHTYTQSNDQRIDDFRTDFHSYSSSINDYTESTDFRLDSLEVESGSIRNYTSSINDYTESTDFRLTSLETESGSIRTDFNEFTSSFNTGSFTGSFTGAFTPSTSIIPTETDVFDLGSPTKRFKDLYLLGSTIFLGDIILKEESGTLQIVNELGEQQIFSGTFVGNGSGLRDLTVDVFAQNVVTSSIDSGSTDDMIPTARAVNERVIRARIEAADGSVIFVDSGDGLSGGGDGVQIPILSLNTGSTHFIEGVETLFDQNGLISGSEQISFTDISDKPTLVSGSEQILLSATDGFDTYSSSVSSSIKSVISEVEFDDILNKPTLVSGSSQVSFTDISDKPTLVSGSEQVSFTDISDKPTLVSSSLQIVISDTDGFDTYSSSVSSSISVLDVDVDFGDIVNKPTLISGSSQVSFTDISDKPTLISGSEQVSFTDISDKPTLISGSSQVSFTGIVDKPTLVSGSAQIDYNGIQNTPDLSALEEVFSFPTLGDFPTTGELNKVYIAEDTGFVYRWSGSEYIQLTDQTAIWGQIGGTLSNQTDLQNALNGKANVDQTMFIGTTSVAINRGSSAQTLSGVSVSGNAGTATVLQNARTIGGVSFDGSTNINLPGVNTTGNQDTSGNAATATSVPYSGITSLPNLVSGSLTPTPVVDEVVVWGNTLGSLIKGTGININDIALREGDDGEIFFCDVLSPIVNGDPIIFSTDGQIDDSLTVGTRTSVGSKGEIRATDDITAYLSSDERLKTNIKRIESPLEKVNQLNGIMFDWEESYIQKRGGEDGFFVRKHDTGIIAQEVQKVLPEVVGNKEDGYLGVKYEKLVPLLIESIKELSNKVEELTNKIEELENR